MIERASVLYASTVGCRRNDKTCVYTRHTWKKADKVNLNSQCNFNFLYLCMFTLDLCWIFAKIETGNKISLILCTCVNRDLLSRVERIYICKYHIYFFWSFQFVILMKARLILWLFRYLRLSLNWFPFSLKCRSITFQFFISLIYIENDGDTRKKKLKFLFYRGEWSIDLTVSVYTKYGFLY